MCGRYLIEDEAYADILQILNDLNAAQNRINVDNTSSVEGHANGGTVHDEFIRGEVFPTNVAPVITGDGVMAVKWGFPHWKNTGVIINARAETALEKKMFGKPLRESRCVVPSSGFFEWSRSGGHDRGSSNSSGGGSRSSGDRSGGGSRSSGDRSGGNKKKDKYLLRRPGEHILYMAGIVNTFQDALGAPYSAFVILTTAANEYVSPIHDRMPVILSPDEVDLWSRDDDFMEYVLHRSGPELSSELSNEISNEYYDNILD